MLSQCDDQLINQTTANESEFKVEALALPICSDPCQAHPHFQVLSPLASWNQTLSKQLFLLFVLTPIDSKCFITHSGCLSHTTTHTAALNHSYYTVAALYDTVVTFRCSYCINVVATLLLLCMAYNYCT